jgi:hypothetical protein
MLLIFLALQFCPWWAWSLLAAALLISAIAK